MYSLVTYYAGPTTDRSILDKALGRPGTINYSYNPQLYQEGFVEPLKNFGVGTLSFQPNTVPPLEQILLDIKQHVTTQLLAEGGIEYRTLLIPAENVTVSVEPSRRGDRNL